MSRINNLHVHTRACPQYHERITSEPGNTCPHCPVMCNCDCYLSKHSPSEESNRLLFVLRTVLAVIQWFCNLDHWFKGASDQKMIYVGGAFAPPPIPRDKTIINGWWFVAKWHWSTFNYMSWVQSHVLPFSLHTVSVWSERNANPRVRLRCDRNNVKVVVKFQYKWSQTKY